MSPEQHLAALRRVEVDGETPDFLFFWGHRPRRDGSIGTGCLSQWCQRRSRSTGHVPSHPHAARPSRWRGLKLLGFALMNVRDQLPPGRDQLPPGRDRLPPGRGQW